MTKNIVTLAAGLIVTKGSATPSVELPNVSANSKDSKVKRIALTYKISDSDYQKMKLLGVEKRMSTQSILDEAFSDYLSKQST